MLLLEGAGDPCRGHHQKLGPAIRSVLDERGKTQLITNHDGRGEAVDVDERNVLRAGTKPI